MKRPRLTGDCPKSWLNIQGQFESCIPCDRSAWLWPAPTCTIPTRISAPSPRLVQLFTRFSRNLVSENRRLRIRSYVQKNPTSPDITYNANRTLSFEGNTLSGLLWRSQNHP